MGSDCTLRTCTGLCTEQVSPGLTDEGSSSTRYELGDPSLCRAHLYLLLFLVQSCVCVREGSVGGHYAWPLEEQGSWVRGRGRLGSRRDSLGPQSGLCV